MNSSVTKIERMKGLMTHRIESALFFKQKQKWRIVKSDYVFVSVCICKAVQCALPSHRAPLKKTNEHFVPVHQADCHLLPSKHKQTKANSGNGTRSALNCAWWAARRAKAHFSLTVCPLSRPDLLTGNWTATVPLRIYYLNILASCFLMYLHC